MVASFQDSALLNTRESLPNIKSSCSRARGVAFLCWEDAHHCLSCRLWLLDSTIDTGQSAHQIFSAMTVWGECPLFFYF